MIYETLAHSRYMCKYHVVFIPKYRKKTLFVKVRPWLAERLKELAAQKECRKLPTDMPEEPAFLRNILHDIRMRGN